MDPLQVLDFNTDIGPAAVVLVLLLLHLLRAAMAPPCVC